MDKNKIIIEKLELELKYQKIKNNIYKYIINHNTDINIDEMFEDESSTINIHNCNNINTSLIINNFIDDKKFTIITKNIEQKQQSPDVKPDVKKVVKPDIKPEVRRCLLGCFVLFARDRA